MFFFSAAVGGGIGPVAVRNVKARKSYFVAENSVPSAVRSLGFFGRKKVIHRPDGAGVVILVENR